MNSAAYRLLTTNVKARGNLNAEKIDRYSGARPEVIIPCRVSSAPAPPQDKVEFAPAIDPYDCAASLLQG